jgi:hypothetical protein
MDRNAFSAGVSLVVAMICAFAVPLQMRAQDPKTPYPRMAPVDRYLMPNRDAEIALARTAAPESISHDAEILVLGRHGYETAVRGTNGFVCLVERSWDAPAENPEFWNPKGRGPDCYNPPAARTILPLILKRAELALAGESKEQIMNGVKAFGRKEVPALQPGAMCYMMSKEAYLTDQGSHNLSHLMFFVPEGADWGQDLPGSPVFILDRQVAGAPVPVSMYMVPVRRWSDGTSAIAETH